MPDWAAWGDDELDWDRDDRKTTKKQVICDECGKFSKRALSYRDDFETPKRLCASCCDTHDNHPDVTREREHIEAMDASERDDF